MTSSRWSLPSDITDIVRLSGFLESMDTYRHLASVNSVFQTLALMGLIIRLLSLASVVPKVSIITSTLSGCIEPLVYFMIPFLLLLTCFAFMGSSCFGYRVKTLSSFSAAFLTLMEFTFFGGGGKDQKSSSFKSFEFRTDQGIDTRWDLVTPVGMDPC